MKVLFLDIDGVLNYESFIHKLSAERKEGFKGDLIMDPGEWYGWRQIDPEKVRLLNEVVYRTGCKVVISSSWRQRFETIEIDEMFHKNGFDGQVIGATPRTFQVEEGGRYSWRGEEIERWLSWTTRVTKWAAVDDDNISPELSETNREFFVQTSWKTGLMSNQADRLIRLLRDTL